MPGSSGPEHYNYFRDYDPAIGRYIKSDPVGLNGGLSTFSYAYDDPLLFGDPEGLQVIVPPGSVGGAGAAGAVAGGSWWGSQGAGGSGAYGQSHGYGTWGAWGGSDSWSGSSSSSCEPPKDPCKGLRDQLEKHERKLRDYMNDPPTHDNLGLLGQGYDHVIIPGRIRSLQKQIENFRKQLAECEAKNGKGR